MSLRDLPPGYSYIWADQIPDLTPNQYPLHKMVDTMYEKLCQLEESTQKLVDAKRAEEAQAAAEEKAAKKAKQPKNSAKKPAQRGIRKRKGADKTGAGTASSKVKNAKNVEASS